MRKLLIIIALIPILVFPQIERNHQINWQTNLLYESNGLNKNFLNTFLYGGYITNKMKTDWIGIDVTDNIFYSELSNGLTYTHTKYHFGISIADRNILNASLADDLLRFGLEGNYNYQNQTLDFSNTNIRIDRFQQYKLFYTKNFKYLNMSTALSYLNGNHHLSYIIDKGSIFTSSYGTALDINYDMQVFVTDTADFSVFTSNGNGLAIDFNTNFTLQDYDITLYITDLGFIMWDTKSITLATDSNFNFQGIEIEDVLSFNDSVLEANNIQDDILQTKNSSFKSYIPAHFGISVMHPITYKNIKSVSGGINVKWQPYHDNKPLSLAKIGQGISESNYAPLYWISARSTLTYFDLLSTLSYGGYSADTNIGLAISKGEKYKFILGTQHLEDLLNGDKAQAVSVYFNIKLLF